MSAGGATMTRFVWASVTAAVVAGTPETEARMWDWAASLGADVSQLRTVRTEEGRRGLAADGCSEDGCADGLFRLPFSVVMSCSDVVNSSALRDALGEMRATGGACDEVIAVEASFTMDSGTSLAVLVAVERLKGAASHWFPYLATLPRPTSPSYDVAAGALGLSVDDVVRARHARARFQASTYASSRVTARASEWLEFSSVVAKSLAARGAATADADLARSTVLWALATVYGRSVPIDDMGHALIPFWDLINHASGAVIAPVSWDDDSVYYFSANYRSGEIVHDYNFGSPCPVEWLAQYGFIPEHLAAVALSPPDDARENALGPWERPGCSDVALDGRHFGLPRDENDLLALAATSPAEGARVARALDAKADGLEADAALAEAATTHPDDMRRSAAVVMLLERRALRRARGRLSRLYDGDL